MLTFKTFLSIIHEAADDEQIINQLQTQLNQIDTRINQISQRIQPLNNQKIQIQRRLAPLLKKRQIDASKQTNQDPNQPMQANATTTPGSTRSATPGTQATIAG